MLTPPANAKNTFFLQDSEVHGELAFLFVCLTTMCPFHYSKTIKLMNKKKSETNAAKKCSKMFQLIAYFGQGVGGKASTQTTMDENAFLVA